MQARCAIGYIAALQAADNHDIGPLLAFDEGHVRVAFETTKQHVQPTEGQPSERQHIPVNRCKRILHVRKSPPATR